MVTKISSFKNLHAWVFGHELVLEVYNLTKNFPSEEKFGLVSQMRRCCVSITSNIAEGFSRQSYKEKISFYSISLGSVTELQDQLLICKDLHYINDQQYFFIDEKTTTIHKLVNGLIKASRTKLIN